ncbi:MAG: succinate dehydrogenase assembly factor 4 [Gammaproteobacteria bacterium]
MSEQNNRTSPATPPQVKPEAPQPAPTKPREIGGPKGPEPTRYGDWEKGGRCIDF